MSAVVAIGDERRLAGYALAGVVVKAASTAGEIGAAWAAVETDAGLLLLTPEAYAALEAPLAGGADLLWVVLPS